MTSKDKKEFNGTPLGPIPSVVTLDEVLSSLKWHEFAKLPKSVQALGGPAAAEEEAWKHYEALLEYYPSRIP